MFLYPLAPENFVLCVTKKNDDVRAIAFTIEHVDSCKLLVEVIFHISLSPKAPRYSAPALTRRSTDRYRTIAGGLVKSFPLAERIPSMRTSQFSYPRSKEAPSDAEIVNTS